jgi:hypothetical protein
VVQVVTRVEVPFNFYLIPGLFPIPDSSVELKTVVQNVLKVIDPDFQESVDRTDPILTLAFDEAHTISTSSDGSTQWTTFNSLRLALRTIRELPVWSLFLSTTGKLIQFAPPPSLDMSARIIQGKLINPTPFSALGFDHLAVKCRSDGTTTLENVVKLPYKLSLGRPL